MIEESKNCKIIVIHAMCECGGEFKQSGVVLTSYPEKYGHICDRCGKGENFEKSYPYFSYEECK